MVASIIPSLTINAVYIRFKSQLGNPLLPALLVWLLATVCGLVPPFSRDALNSHLLLAMLWQDNGLLWRDTNYFFTAYPPLAELPWLLFSHQPWDILASCWHALGALLTLFFFDKALRNIHFNTSMRRMLALSWMLTPVVISLCTWAYVDLWLCAASAAIVECLLRPRWTMRDAWYFGFLLAIAALIKYNGVPLAIAGSLALLWRWRDNNNVWQFVWRAALPVFILALPWYISNWLLLGHPLYPQGSSATGMHWLEYRILAKDETFFWALLTPLRQFFWGEVNNPSLFDGMLHPLWLLGFFGMWYWRKQPRCAALAIMVIVYVSFALSAGTRARYWLPGMLPLLPLVGLVIWKYKIPKTIITLSFAPVILSSLLYILWLAPWGYWQYGKDAFLQQKIPEYALNHFIANELPKDASLYLLWTGSRAYYIERHFETSIGDGLMGMQDYLQNKRQLQSEYILLSRRQSELTLGLDMPKEWQQFLINDSCLIATHNGFELRYMHRCR
ncbi:MAG: hypothetical protein R8K21_06150 [Mariprofundales bacterium]